MTRGTRSPERERLCRRDQFDAAVEGARYHLPRELAVAIWERACIDATDGAGRLDTSQAQRRFHELATRVADGGRLQPEVGRETRVERDGGSASERARLVREIVRGVPGRETLVTAEARRWAELDDEPAGERVEIEAEPRGRGSLGRGLRAETLARMEHAYGQRFDDVELHTDSAEVPFGQQAFTRGRQIYLEHGADELDGEHGEHVIAHELAHVAQQAQPVDAGGRPATRAALEADAHQAALAALAGRAASVRLFAPSGAALGFSNGKPPRAAPAARPPAGRGAAPAQPGAPRTSGPTRAPAAGGARPGAAPARPGAAPARPGAAPARPGAPHGAAGAPPTAAAPRRGPGNDNLRVPEAPTALTPGAAGRLQTIQTSNQGVAAATTTLPTAEQQTDVARAAVVEPQAEQDAHAQHDVVAGVDDRPPPSPEIVAACDHIRQVIRDKRPPDEDKLVDAKPKEMAQAAGEQMSAGVEQRAGSVREGYAGMQQTPQGTPSTTPVPATLPPAQAQTPPVNAAAGTPDPLAHDDVSLDSDVAAQQQQIQDAGMNTEAGQLVEDGPIGDARGGVGDLQSMAATDPQKVLADQAAAIAHAQGDMRALQASAEKALADARAGTVTQIGQHTTGVKGSEEQQRAAAGVQMQAVFTRTQQTVDRLLQPLSGNAVARWEAGVAQLSTEFESSLASVKQKIEDRHSGLLGGLTELGDNVFGLPEWVTLEYDRAEARFADGATSLITDISRDVNSVIEDCKKLIDLARKDIEAIVKSLPASLQSWAQGEATKLGQQLDQLSQRVDQTQHGLNQDLIGRANGAVQTVRERVHELREAAKGLLGKIADAIAEFIKDPAKAIINGLLRILGIPPASFWALVDKLGAVIDGIAADPKKFANTLMAGVGQGFQQFFHNLPAHLGQALFQWLFSKLGEAGVTMPTDFSIKSIITLVLEVMGITWTRIKTILGKHIGAENAELLDQAVKMIQVLIEKGPQGVFEMISEQLNPSMIIDAIKDAAIQYVMQAIITRVTARILMMLNPAGAILQAIEAIYRVIKWVLDNAARIFTLIESVVNGAAQILAGNVSGVANLVESSLVRLMVPVIDFLADYLGLGGIPNAIKNVILGLQSKVEKILDRVIGFIVTKAKALWEALKASRRRPQGQDGDQPPGSADERRAELEQKLKLAQTEIQERLHGHHTEREGRAIVAEIAAKHGVQQTLRFENHRWHLTLKINPELDVFFPGKEGEEVRQILIDANKTVKSLEAKLTLMYNDALGSATRTAERRERARQEVRAQVGGVEGLRGSAETDPSLAERQHAAGTGDEFERRLAERRQAEARASGQVFVGSSEGTRSGFDSTVIDVDAGTVTVHEDKHGDLRTLDAEASSRGTSVPVDRRITAQPGPGPGSIAARHLAANPDDAALLASDHILVQERSNFESKLSATVNNLETNLDTVIGQLEAAKAEASSDEVGRLDRAIELVRAIRSNEGGELRRVISVRGSATETNMRAAAQLLTASAQRLDRVNIEDIIRRVDDDGNTIEAP